MISRSIPHRLSKNNKSSADKGVPVFPIGGLVGWFGIEGFEVMGVKEGGGTALCEEDVGARTGAEKSKRSKDGFGGAILDEVD